jgi:hypothetical protein
VYGTLRIEKNKLLIIKQLYKMENTKELNKEKQCDIHVVSKRLLLEMKKTACIKEGSCRSSVFSAFELACALNDNITMYRIRKCLAELKKHDFINKDKFYVDNESNLMCWKWYITSKGFLNVC